MLLEEVLEDATYFALLDLLSSILSLQLLWQAYILFRPVQMRIHLP